MVTIFQLNFKSITDISNVLCETQLYSRNLNIVFCETVHEIAWTALRNRVRQLFFISNLIRLGLDDIKKSQKNFVPYNLAQNPLIAKHSEV